MIDNALVAVLGLELLRRNNTLYHQMRYCVGKTVPPFVQTKPAGRLSRK